MKTLKSKECWPHEMMTRWPIDDLYELDDLNSMHKWPRWPRLDDLDDLHDLYEMTTKVTWRYDEGWR